MDSASASYFDSFLPRYLGDDPELSSAFGLVARDADAPSGGLLSAATDDFVRGRIARARSCRDALAALDASRLDAEAALSRRILGWYLDTVAAADAFCLHSYPVHARGGLSDVFLSGISQQFPLLMIHGHALFTRQHAFDYVSRLYAVANKFDELHAALEERARSGLCAPRAVLLRAIEGMRATIAGEARAHPILANFRDKLLAIKEFNDGERAALVQMAAGALGESVYPAYAALIERCESLLWKAPESCSLATRPGGDAYYRYLLKKSVTAEVEPLALHATARSEIARVLEELRGHAGASRGDEPHAPDDGDAPLAEAQRCIDAAAALLDRVVAKPLAKPARVATMVPSMQAYAGQGYYEPPSCLSGGYGVFHLNPSKLGAGLAALRTLTVHETIPGHHLQTVYAYDRRPALPPFRAALPFRGYSEGWAVYAERLVAELGFYADDAAGDFGRLEADLRRSARMWLDTGVHAHGWSGAEARAQAQAVLGERSWIDEEIERVSTQPGDGSAYKVGELTLLSVREKSRRAQGAAFDLREFHHRILDLGPCPLALLEEVVVPAAASSAQGRLNGSRP